MLRTAAALQVMPDHAHLLVQLESLAAAACVGGRQTRRATRTEWEALLQEPALCESDLALQDDPYEHFFTERFDFDGGPYLVFPGQNLQGTSVLSSLANALRIGQHDLPARFLEQAGDLLTGVLKLSDQLIRQLGFPPHMLPAGPHWLEGGSVHPSLPAPHALNALRSAVTLHRTQMLRLGLREARALRLNLVTRFGSLAPDAALADGSPLLLRPLVQAGNELIVACPHALIGATARHVIRLAQEQGAAPALSELVAEVNAQRVRLALHRLGARELEVALPSRPGTHEALYVLDAELLLHVVVQSEPLTTMDSQVLVSEWHLTLPEMPVSVPPELPAAQRLNLFVPCAHGDAYMLKVSRAERAEHLVLELDDLEVFATAHRNEPLALYRLYLSEQALTSQFDVVSPSGTERMVHCIEHSFIRSFPERGERTLLLGTAPANDWRRRVKGQQDQHLVEWGHSGMLIPVERAMDAPPGLYLPVVPVWSATAMLVETETLSVWVLDGSGHGLDEENSEPSLEDGVPAALDMVVQAVALWLVHLIPHLPAFRHPRVTLVIHAQAAEGHEHFRLYADRRTQTAQVMLGQVFHDELARPDNAGERHLMAAVYHVLVELATGWQATVAETRRIMDLVVSLGDQRAVFNVQIGENAELDPRNLVRPRLVQFSEWHAVQVVAGETLAQQHGWTPGPIPVHGRHVLEEANALLYSRLMGLLADADGAQLIDALVSLYESLRHDVAWLTHTGVSRTLTHGQFARQIEGRHHLSSMAYRFLIELVVARPPRGTRLPSLLLIDELLALATAIIDYGLVGDAIRHDLGTVELSYGPDHALRAAAPEYQEASQAQGASFLSQLLQEVNAWRYRAREDIPETVWADPMLGRVDDAFLDLYGVPLQELMGFLNEVQNVGDEQQGRHIRLSLKAFLAEIRERTRWPLTQVLLALAPFVLTEREDFLKPPAPYRPSDTFPWQFGRELSLVRRPLLLVPGEEGMDILWGNRIVEGTKQYWLSVLVGDARLTVPDEARTDKARGVRTFTALRQEAGAAFNAQVASALRSLGLSVQENVRKIARRRLSVAGDDLGDIDVLAVDEARRTIWLIECKDYVSARTPAELAGDLNALHRGIVRQDGRRERSLSDRHRRRLIFVQQHQEELITWLHLAEAEWTVRACVVMSAEPFGLLRVTTDIPVWSLQELQEAISPS